MNQTKHINTQQSQNNKSQTTKSRQSINNQGPDNEDIHSVASISIPSSSQKKIEHGRKPSQPIKVNSSISGNAKKSNTTKTQKQSNNSSSLNINYEPSEFLNGREQSSAGDSQRSSAVSISISEKDESKISIKQKQKDQGKQPATIQKVAGANKYKNTLQATSINKYLGGTSKSSTLYSSKVGGNPKSGNNSGTNNNTSAFDADNNMYFQQKSNVFQNNQEVVQNNQSNNGQLLINDLLNTDQIQQIQFNQNEQIGFKQANEYATVNNDDIHHNYYNGEQQIKQEFVFQNDNNYNTKMPVAQLNLNLSSIQNSLQSPNIIKPNGFQRDSISITNNSNIYSNNNFQLSNNIQNQNLFADQENFEHQKYSNESQKYFKRQSEFQNPQDQYQYELQLHKRGQSSIYNNIQIDKSEISGNQRYNKSQAQGAQPGRFANLMPDNSNQASAQYIQMNDNFKRDISNHTHKSTNNLYPFQEAILSQDRLINNQQQFAMMDSITNYDGNSAIRSQYDPAPPQIIQFQKSTDQLHRNIKIQQILVNNFNPDSSRVSLNQNQMNGLNPYYNASQSHRNFVNSQNMLNSINQANVQNNSQAVFENMMKRQNENEKILELTIHSVDINIPPSIKMHVFCIFKQQTVQTVKECRISSLSKKRFVDFKNQILQIKLDQLDANQSNKQKLVVKLVAVNEDKQKLIGLLNIDFDQLYFHPFSKQEFKFNKSIDDQSKIYLSGKINFQNKFSQGDRKTADFSIADNMGDEEDEMQQQNKNILNLEKQRLHSVISARYNQQTQRTENNLVTRMGKESSTQRTQQMESNQLGNKKNIKLIQNSQSKMKMRDTSIDFAVTNSSIINNQSDLHFNNQSQLHFNNQITNKLGSDIFKDQSIIQSQSSIIIQNQIALKKLDQLFIDQNEQHNQIIEQNESEQKQQIEINISEQHNNQNEDQSQNQIVLDISKTSDNNRSSNHKLNNHTNEKNENEIGSNNLQQQFVDISGNIQNQNLEQMEKVNIDLSGSVDATAFKENLTENIQEDYLTLNNPDIIQVNNYQTQINQESDVKQEQINLTSPLARSKRISKYDNEYDQNNKIKKSFLNSLPKSPLNKIGLNKEQFTAFNADSTSNLMNSQLKQHIQINQNVQIDPKENEGDKIEVVGKIVGQQIKKTFNFLYDKIQEGVITTLNQAIENQKEHERLNNRRAHSSNPSLDQQRFLFNNQHQIKINDQSQHQNNQTINYPPALSPSLKSLQNINMKTARESRSVFRQQLPINANDFQDKTQNDKTIQGRPPQHTTRDRIENKLIIKSQLLIDKNLQNEVANLRQEKIFLAQTIQNQEIQFQEQFQISMEKQKYKNEKNERKQKNFKEFIEELQKQIKIESVQLDDSLQQENLKYFQYEVLKHIHNQSEEIQKLKEQNLKKEGALEMKTEELKQKSQELYDFQEQQKQEEIQKQIDQSDFENEREAQQLKMQLQNEKIQEMSKIVEERNKTLKIQEEHFRKQEQQIQNLNDLINQQNGELNYKEKSLQEKIQQKQREVDEYKDLNKNVEIQYRQKENQYLQDLEILQKRVEELQELKDMNQSQVKQYNEIHLQKDKKWFKMECDMEQMQKLIDKIQKENQVLKIQKEELQNQNQDNQQRLKMTEFQLIQAKSSWAESEHEREQLFNRVQELEERLDPGSFSQRSYQRNLDSHSSKSKSNI